MKKSILLLALAATLCGCDKWGDDIDRINERLDTLEGTAIPTVNEQVAAINGTITELKTMDVDLGTSIANLQTYVDGQLKDTKDWAGATLATLEQYYALQSELSALKIAVAESDSTQTAAIAALKDSIASCEDGMKQWVNATLADGYYGIAAIDAKIKALQQEIADGDAALSDSLKAGDDALREDIAKGDGALQAQKNSAFST